MAPAAFPRAKVLFLAENSVQSLLSSTLVSQVEALLGSHRIQDAADLADQQRKKVEGNIRINEDEVREPCSLKAIADQDPAGRVALRVPAHRLAAVLRDAVRGRGKEPLQWRYRPTTAHQLLP